MRTLFLTSSVNHVAHDIVQKIDVTKYKKLVYITTAAEGEEGDKQWMENDRRALRDVGFEVFDYTVTGKTEAQIRQDLSEVKTIYIGGGNTFYLLQEIKQSGFDKIVLEFIDQGKVYIGTSAGSVVAGPDIWPIRKLDRVESAPKLKEYSGLGLVDFVVFPHWGSDYFREVYLNNRMDINYNTDHKIILLTDHQYIHVQDDWYKIEEVQ